MKHNKIIVCVCSDDHERRQMVQRVAIKLGFALTMSDANKVVRHTPRDFDLSESYFIIAASYNLNESPHTTHQLYRLAIQGVAVVVGVKRLQPLFEPMCYVYYQGDL